MFIRHYKSNSLGTALCNIWLGNALGYLSTKVPLSRNAFIQYFRSTGSEAVTMQYAATITRLYIHHSTSTSQLKRSMKNDTLPKAVSDELCHRCMHRWLHLTARWYSGQQQSLAENATMTVQLNWLNLRQLAQTCNDLTYVTQTSHVLHTASTVWLLTVHSQLPP